MKQRFAEELVHLEEALKQEKESVQAEMKRLREELTDKHNTELASMRSDIEKERTLLELALLEEKEKLKSLEAALHNDESRNCLVCRSPSSPKSLFVTCCLVF